MTVFQMPTRRARLGACILLSALAVGLPAKVFAQAPDACAEGLEAAERSYTEGAFDEAAHLALCCLQEEEPGPEAEVRAYRLLILARLRQQEVPRARAAAVQLLRASPGYAPDPVRDPPSYVDFVTRVKDEMRRAGLLPEAPREERAPRFERRGTWLAIGGGLVLAGLIAIFAGGG